MRKITMTGPFTDAELADLFAFVRKCDDANPGAQFTVKVVTPGATLDEMEATMRAGLRPRADRVTAIDLAAQVDQHQDVELPPERLYRHFSGRLQRRK